MTTADRPPRPVEGEPLPSGMKCGRCRGPLLVSKVAWVEGETSIGGLSSAGQRWIYSARCGDCGANDDHLMDPTPGRKC